MKKGKSNTLGYAELQRKDNQIMKSISAQRRAETPFTNEHFAAFCEKMVGQPYWYGCCLYKCSFNLLEKKSRQYPKAYTAKRMTRYKQDIENKKVCADCIGAAKGYAWTNGGMGVLESIGSNQTFFSKYASNGCPDKGANSMFTYAQEHGMQWSEIGSFPELVGLALYKPSHTGYYVGGGFVVEWKGFAYGCVKEQKNGRGWTHWYRLPFLDYGDGSDNCSSVLPQNKQRI